MFSFRNSLTHCSLSSIISRQLACPVDHSFKMYEMFLLIQPFLPAPSCPTVPKPALCTWSRVLQGPPASIPPGSFSPFPSTLHVQGQTTLTKAHIHRWNFLIWGIQRENRNYYWAGRTRYWQGEKGQDATQLQQWEKHHEDIGCILPPKNTRIITDHDIQNSLCMCHHHDSGGKWASRGPKLHFSHCCQDNRK